MPKIKSIDQIGRKWSEVTPARQNEYIEGVENPRADWATQTKAAKDSYNKGIQAAIQANSFEKGVTKAGTEKWRLKTVAKGPTRWAQGVAVSRDDYEAGFAPYREVIASTNLPPRGPKGDPSNINRVAVLAKALHEKKMRG